MIVEAGQKERGRQSGESKRRCWWQQQAPTFCPFLSLPLHSRLHRVLISINIYKSASGDGRPFGATTATGLAGTKSVMVKQRSSYQFCSISLTAMIRKDLSTIFFFPFPLFIKVPSRNGLLKLKGKLIESERGEGAAAGGVSRRTRKPDSRSRKRYWEHRERDARRRDVIKTLVRVFHCVWFAFFSTLPIQATAHW